MVTVLFSAPTNQWDDYREVLPKALSEVGVSADVMRDAPPNKVDYIVYAPGGPVSDFSPYTKAKAVLSLWAGVESIVTNETLTQPLARMVDSGLADGMAEWVGGHVMRYHLGMDADIRNDAHQWTPRVPPLAGERTVGILGMGALGQACAKALIGLGFDVQGWARRENADAPCRLLTGEDGLHEVLGTSDVLVLLLPLTADTENLINSDRLSCAKPGAYLLNPGRGALIDDTALIAALDTGALAHATLDVFRTEPLPSDHAFWHHPKITVTPHLASATRPRTASQFIAENIRRGEAGEPFLHLVDRVQGY